MTDVERRLRKILQAVIDCDPADAMNLSPWVAEQLAVIDGTAAERAQEPALPPLCYRCLRHHDGAIGKRDYACGVGGPCKESRGDGS